MNLLFDINHPGHVHLFRHFINHRMQCGDTVVVMARHKDVTLPLLNYYGIPYVGATRPSSHLAGMAVELLMRDVLAYRLHARHHFHAAFGTSATIAHLSLMTTVTSYNLCEDDDDVVPLYAWMTYPFTSRILNTRCLHYRYWSGKRVQHNSYHKLAYLHPNRFSPDASVVQSYGLTPGAYVVMRLSALRAHHDRRARGLSSELQESLRELFGGLQVVVTQEDDRTHLIKPWDMHHVLAHARLLVCDSQTMAMEAAVLGVPSVRYSSFTGRLSCLEELEHEYGLTFGFAPGSERELLGKVRAILGDISWRETWASRRQKLLTEKVDFTQWLIEYADRESASWR